jgi:hypothetical protein
MVGRWSPNAWDQGEFAAMPAGRRLGAVLIALRGVGFHRNEL